MAGSFTIYSSGMKGKDVFCKAMIKHGIFFLRDFFRDFWGSITGQTFRISIEGKYPEKRMELYWFYGPIEKAAKEHLGLSRCIFSRYRPNIEVRSPFEEPWTSPNKSRGRLFMTGECVRPHVETRFSKFNSYCLEECDLAFGFDYEESVASPKYKRLPLWILYYFSASATKDEIAATLKKFILGIGARPRFCSMVANHDDEKNLRASMKIGLESIDEVSCPGTFLHNDDSLLVDYQDDKVSWLRQFRFTICPENVQGEGYVTEKLFHAFEAGCIPIYWGYSRDPEPAVINKNALIWWDPENGGKKALDLIGAMEAERALYARFAQQSVFVDGAVEWINARLGEAREAVENLVITSWRKRYPALGK